MLGNGRPGPLVERRLADLLPLATAKRLSLSSVVDQPNARVRFDAHCLENALGNLLGNALKFTVRGGVWANLARDDDGCLTLSIRDTGIGIERGFHGLIAKVTRSRLYRVTPRGHRLMAALLTFRQVDFPQAFAAAA